MEEVQVKLVLHVGDRKEEVRRFPLTQPLLFIAIDSKVRQLFPAIAEEEVSIGWEDEEGDLVTISSDEELAYALQCKKRQGQNGDDTLGLFRLEVTLIENPWWLQVGSVQIPGEEHPGVVCQCCHQPVKGFRYKCVSCQNYDLCRHCEARQLHPGHDMVRIPSPRSYPPHFFTRLHRLFERCSHSSPTVPKPGNALPATNSPNEGMARDLMEEDSADLSDLDLEVASEMPNLAGSRRRVMSDPGAGKNQADTSSSLLPEGLPSFEEVTRSMQDLAEREVEVWPSPTVPQPLCQSTLVPQPSFPSNTVVPQPVCPPIVPQPGPPTVCQPGGQVSSGILPQCRGEALVRQPGCEKNPGITPLRPLPKESLNDRRSVQAGSCSLGKLNVERRSHSLEMIEGKRREEEEDQVDTSESLRNLQQEIESLLAPLTPLPDLEQVPKVKRLEKAGEGAEQESRTGSFEMVSLSPISRYLSLIFANVENWCR